MRNLMQSTAEEMERVGVGHLNNLDRHGGEHLKMTTKFLESKKVLN